MSPQQEITIFFSWQSQLDKNKNTNFIRKALRKAIKKIESKNKNIKIILDEATRGETGSPSITETIQQKIPLCNIFIADVTITSPKNNENILTPNPNVMFELGFAVAEIGWPRTICLINEHYQHTINELPFDIRGQRISPYNSDASAEELTENLYGYITAIIDKNPKTPQELRGVSIKQIQHERNIKNINFIMNYLHTPTLNRLVSEAPTLIRWDVFICWESFKSILNSNEFQLYDLKLKAIFNAMYDAWGNLLGAGPFYYETASNGVDHVFPKHKTYELKEARNAWIEIENQAETLKSKLRELTTYLHENYVEVDLDETNQQAWRDLIEHRPDLDN
ncbi:TPA: nucleotide-binding protein [Klebsiella pneumoniae subsp. pneumoniae]|nr:nucleotide-binding protein [Klebsiella pneumoniae subsp. pneumoniae]HDT1620498.1 nucleotide-binding protein [Klebsiella pneumoniae]HDU5457728.1 nucleotide-binding protein [Klebsiella pneumoniae subsp. pneumoniae]HEO9154596.1 nucleotide-binding protein [Klebsiella pneumoniae subsp. pneumoniae]HEO9174497.1 nucleotide-binding protein [Klebsiella pneumoniae subsp. pneumoniae]